MPIKYKIEILPALKAIGYTQTRIREEKLIGQATLSQLRKGELVSWATIETLCRLLECQPGDILEYIPDDPNKPETDEETDALRAALLNQIKGL
jgi:putative transcriptional regulator|nr:MAG TPA: Cro/C1-type HTH DNA-binding domain protein [Caudoviricetes sp.]